MCKHKFVPVRHTFMERVYRRFGVLYKVYEVELVCMKCKESKRYLKDYAERI